MAYKRGNRIWVRGINNKYTEYLVHLRTKETRKEIRKEVSFEHISAEATPVEVRSSHVGQYLETSRNPLELETTRYLSSLSGGDV